MGTYCVFLSLKNNNYLKNLFLNVTLLKHLYF
ncbi:unknown [Parabacteroides johnsonii CAG:246]|nr:unknown [Parabacteroides johnsonii CAG:246]